MEAHREKYAADISSIKEAHERIKPYIHITPVLTSESLNLISGKSLFFKCECFQKGCEKKTFIIDLLMILFSEDLSHSPQS